MMQPGPALAFATWVMAVLCLALVALRLYTRVHLVRFVGAEDYLFAATGVFFLVFSCAIQAAVRFGLGQSFWSLSLQQSSDAILWTYIANTFAITGNAMAKLTTGLFLLRVVQLRWHKVALWCLVGVTASTSAALTIMLWNQSTPVKMSWDPFRTPGHWNLQIQPMSVGLGVWSSACDFFFAAFPWLFIWSLRMQRREKIMLASSMSLGIIAGICGIIRTVVLARLNVLNYTLTFVTYFAWAGAEIAVSMVCLAIPTLRPLYLRHRGLAVTSTHPRHPADDVLPQFTMCGPTPGAGAMAPTQGPPKFADVDLESGPSSIDSTPRSTPGSTPDSVQDEKFDSVPEVETLPSRLPKAYLSRGQDSVDEILGLYGPNYAHGQGQKHGQIWIKSEVSVQETAATNWPLKK
ncbi:uncharacterized protein SPSK_05290 [Sporothrix schenckii 1099-18]|uniref:Rhodopsin domain-containing protein n=2 Tax=Sporothrix schenckii TaxID=29908 RepID=U7Q3Q5_SPOS1|nr:uncharacterized protein SPSK_05290 [Sporothrix schenckii 1099-18]ERT02453.1 hypothetical protein HMPREF1624_00752 [Sporothrix schenckii ATCC 58251]KJR80275.1 hypothetical protein SPSK_05290 [Sporothrix schenckii 1099-18]